MLSNLSYYILSVIKVISDNGSNGVPRWERSDVAGLPAYPTETWLDAGEDHGREEERARAGEGPARGLEGHRGQCAHEKKERTGAAHPRGQGPLAT